MRSDSASPRSSEVDFARILPLVASVVLLAVLAVRVDLAAVWEAARNVAPATLLALLALSCVFNLGVYADRWQRTLEALGIGHSFGQVLRVHLGTGALRLMMPIHTGEVVNAAVLARRGPGSFGHHVAAIAYLKFLNLTATVGLAAVGWAAGGGSGETQIARVVLASMCVLVPAFLPEFAPVRAALGTLADRLPSRAGAFLGDLLIVYRVASPRAKLLLLVYSVIFQASEVVVCHLLLHALGIEIAFTDTLVVTPLLILVASVPLTFAGIGVRETGAVVLLGSYAPEAQILAFGFCYSLIEYVAPLVLGLPWLPGMLAELAGIRRSD